MDEQFKTQDQEQEDPVAPLLAEIKDLRSQLEKTTREAVQHKSLAEKLQTELQSITAADGQVEAIRSTYQQQLSDGLHQAGLAAFRASLKASGLSSDRIEFAEFKALRGGKRFTSDPDRGFILLDGDGVTEFDKEAKPLTPDRLALQTITALKLDSPTNDAQTLKPFTKDANGNLLVPRSAAVGTDEYRRQMQRPENQEAFDSGKIRIVNDSEFGSSPGSVARQLQTASNSKVLTITRAELGNTRSWCRQNGVDPQQFEQLLNDDRIRVVA